MAYVQFNLEVRKNLLETIMSGGGRDEALRSCHIHTNIHIYKIFATSNSAQLACKSVPSSSPPVEAAALGGTLHRGSHLNYPDTMPNMFDGEQRQATFTAQVSLITALLWYVGSGQDRKVAGIDVNDTREWRYYGLLEYIICSENYHFDPGMPEHQLLVYTFGTAGIYKSPNGKSSSGMMHEGFKREEACIKKQ